MFLLLYLRYIVALWKDFEFAVYSNSEAKGGQLMYRRKVIRRLFNIDLVHIYAPCVETWTAFVF